MSAPFNFTKDSLQSLVPPAVGKRDVYHDAKTTGLQLRVTSSGVKTFSMYRRVKGGQPERVTLGRFPEMTIEQARKMAARVNLEIEEGANPADVKRASKAEPTFAEFFHGDYTERHGAKKRAWAADRQRFRDYLQPSLGNKKLSGVTREMIGRILSDAERAGKAAATVNNIRALASAIFSKAVEWSLLAGNPVAGTRMLKKVSRDRFLQSDEMARFFAALADEPNETIRDYLLMSLLTGARRANVLAMRWVDVNMTDGVWRIPLTKNGDPQNVVLSPESLALLSRRAANRCNQSEFVFPGAGASGHLVEPKKGWLRVLTRAGITDLRIHDLRRTLGSWQAKTGASLPIIGKSLGHKSHQATAIYARLDLDPVRHSVNTATAAMFDAARIAQVAEKTESNYLVAAD